MANGACCHSGGPGDYNTQQLIISGPPPKLMASVLNSVVWFGTIDSCKSCPSRQELFLANIKDRSSSVVGRWTRSNSFSDLRISKGWIVWLRYRYLKPGWWLTAENRQTRQRILVAHSRLQGWPGGGYPTVALRGNALAYSVLSCKQADCLTAPSAVRIVRLGQGSPRTVVKTADSCRPLSVLWVSPAHLVWTQITVGYAGCHASHTTVVGIKDRLTGETVYRRVAPRKGLAAGAFTASDSGVSWGESPVEPVNGARRKSVWWMPLTSTHPIDVAPSYAFASTMAVGHVSWFVSPDAGPDILVAKDLSATGTSGKSVILARGTGAGTKQLAISTIPGITAGNRLLWSEETFFGPSQKDHLTSIDLATMP